MKLHLANYQERTGGGWSFLKNFNRHLPSVDYAEADIYFIAGASMVERHEVEKAKADGKKVILRVDNALRNSRNRNSGMSKLYDYAQLADLIIYQSQWARSFLLPFLKKDGVVILNGVDTNLFNSSNRNAPPDSYLYARSSRDEGKGWTQAWYWFVNNPGKLEIAGKFSNENLEYNFDFYNGERYVFVGEQPNLIDSFKRNRFFLYSYFYDACSNTLLEALASGCEIIDVAGALQTGGAPEIMQCKDISIERMLKEYTQCLQAID